MVLDFKDKLILVTGSARGIGRAVAFEYAKYGAHLILLDILETVKETGEDLKKQGYTAYAFTVDLGNDKDVADLGEKIIKEIGVPDILHNNAFWAPSGCIEEIDIDGIRKALDISVLGYLKIVKAFVNQMIARKVDGSSIQRPQTVLHLHNRTQNTDCPTTSAKPATSP